LKDELKNMLGMDEYRVRRMEGIRRMVKSDVRICFLQYIGKIRYNE
jgi:hypothetical protein